MPFPLEIRVKRTLSRKNDPAAQRASEAFAAARTSILERDAYTCQACGFSAPKGMEVHHIDDNHHNNDPANLVTLCPFCHMYFTCGNRGGVFSAELIFMPILHPVAINQICHTVFAMENIIEQEKQNKESKLNEEDMKKIKELKFNMHAIWNTIVIQGKIGLQYYAQKIFPQLAEKNGIDILYNTLLIMPQQVYQKKKDILSPLRLIPKHSEFPKETLKTWANAWLQRYPPSTWDALIQHAQSMLSAHN